MAIPRSSSIANDALIRLGADTIANLDDGSINAGYIATIYDRCARNLLRAHDWDFSIRRAALAESAGDNLTDKAYMYQMPANSLRMIELLAEDYSHIPSEQWFVEGDQIYSDEPNAVARYVDESIAVSRYDSDFSRSLALMIAWTIAMKITENPKIRAEVYQEFLASLRTAKEHNSRGSKAKEPEPDLWVNSR